MKVLLTFILKISIVTLLFNSLSHAQGTGSAELASLCEDANGAGDPSSGADLPEASIGKGDALSPPETGPRSPGSEFGPHPDGSEKACRDCPSTGGPSTSASVEHPNDPNKAVVTFPPGSGGSSPSGPEIRLSGPGVKEVTLNAVPAPAPPGPQPPTNCPAGPNVPGGGAPGGGGGAGGGGGNGGSTCEARYQFVEPQSGQCRYDNDCPSIAASDPQNWICNADCACERKPPPPGNGPETAAAPQASSSVFVSGAGSAGNVSPSVASRPTLDGNWYTGMTVPWTNFRFWIDASTGTKKLSMYTSEGGVQIFEESATANTYLLRVVLDQFNNERVYSYNPAGKVDEILESGIKTKYQEQGSSLIESSYSCALPAYSNCQLVSTRTLAYSSNGLLLSETVSAGQFVTEPTSITAPYDTTALTTGSTTREWVYYPSGLLKEEWLRSSTGAARLIYRLDWGYILGANRRIRSTSPGFDGTVVETNYTYQSTPSGGLVLRVIGPRMAEELEYDSFARADAKILRRTVMPSNGNDGSTAFSELTTRYAYMPVNGCNFIKEINFPNGAVWKGGWDTFHRLAWEVNTALNDDTAETSTFYQYTHPLDGGRLISVWNEDGYREYRYQWEIANGDIRYHPTKISLWEWFVNGSGIDTANISDAYLDSRGQVVKTIEARQFREPESAGIVTEYVYEAPGEGTGRQLIKKVISGPASASGGVDAASPHTTFARSDLHPVLGLPIAVYSGPLGAETGMQYLRDTLGRVVGINQGSRWTRYYYDAFGELAVVKTSNLDRNGLRPKTIEGRGGAENHYEEHIKRDLLTGAVSASLRDVRAPFELRRLLPTTYSYTQDGYLNGITNILGDKDLFDIGWLGQAWRFRRQISGVTTLVAEKIENLNSTLNRELVAAGPVLMSSTEERFFSGLTKRVYDDSGRSNEYSYDSRGNVIGQESRHAGTLLQKSSFQYDSLSRLVNSWRVNPVTNETKSVSRYEYGKFGLASSTDENGLSTTFSYNPNGSISAMQNSEGSTTLSYEPHQGRVELYSVRTGQHHESFGYGYNQHGEVNTVRALGDGTVTPVITSLGYDSLGNMTWLRGPDGIEKESSVGLDGFVYWNKLTTPGAVAPAVKTTATREFDLLQGFVTVTSKDTGGRAVVSRYNSLGVSDVTTPGQGKTQFLRDAAFSIQEVRNGANLRTVFSRDQFGRLSGSTTTKPSGSFTVSINKDSFNRFQGLSTSDGGAMSIVRGDFGEVSRQTLTYPGGEQRSFSFDRNGPAGFDLNKIFKITDENSNTSWINDYDVVTGKLLQKNVELNGQNIPTAFFQWNGGKLDKVVSGNGAEVAYSYDGFGRVTSKTVTQGSQLIDSTEVVERTQSGKVLRLAYPQSLSYKGRINRYDLLGRLTGYKLVPQLADLALAYDLAPSVQTVSYSYVATDPFRRSSVTVTGAGAGSKTYTLDAATGRYLAINGLAVTYDTLGNITRWGNTRYYYDTLDRLVKVDNTAGSVLALFTYGADGKLASVTTPNEGTKTLRWVGNKWYLSEDSAGLQQANITDPFDYNGLIGYFRKEGTAFPATYNFTSMDSNSAAMRGALTERYSYGPDGEFSLQGGGASQFGQPQGYHGGYRVSSAGVSYFDNRFKIDAAGIFTQPDPDPSYVMFYDVEPGDNHNYVDKDGRAPIPGNDNGAMPHNDRYEFRGIAENSRDTLAIKEQIGDTVIEAAAWTAAGTAAALPTAAVALYISTKDIIENGASFGNVAGAVGSALPFLPKSVTNAVGNSIGAATRGAKGVVSKGGRSISKASQTLFVGSAAERLWWKVSELPKTLSQSQNSLCKRCGDILEDQLWWRQQNKAVEPYLPTNPTIGQKSSLVQTNAAGLKLDSYTARAVEAKYVTIRDGQMFVAPHKNHVGSTINSYSNLARYNREYNISSSVAYKLRYRECNSVRISKKISSLNVGDIETANYYFNRNVDGARWRSDGGWVRPQDDYLVIMDTPKNLVADGATLSIDTLSVSASAPAIHVSGVKEVKVLAIYEPGTSWSMPDL